MDFVKSRSFVIQPGSICLSLFYIDKTPRFEGRGEDFWGGQGRAKYPAEQREVFVFPAASRDARRQTDLKRRSLPPLPSNPSPEGIYHRGLFRKLVGAGGGEERWPSVSSPAQ